jgi:hypothetical protein
MARKKRKLSKSEVLRTLTPGALTAEIMQQVLLERLPRDRDDLNKIIEGSESINSFEKPWFAKPQEMTQAVFDTPSTYRKGYYKTVVMLYSYYDIICRTEEVQGSFHDHGIDYPLLFLMRHLLEISLKDYVAYFRLVVANKLTSIDFPIPAIAKNHNLNILASAVLSLMRDQHKYALNKDHQRLVMECASEFSKVDPTATGFRYFLAKNASRSLSEGVVFDVPRLYGKIREICEIIDLFCLLMEDSIRSLALNNEQTKVIGVRKHPIPSDFVQYASGHKYYIYVDPIYS